MAQPGTAQDCYKQCLIMHHAIDEKHFHAKILFPKGFPGSNPGLGVFFYSNAHPEKENRT